MKSSNQMENSIINSFISCNSCVRKFLKLKISSFSFFSVEEKQQKFPFQVEIFFSLILLKDEIFTN